MSARRSWLAVAAMATLAGGCGPVHTHPLLGPAVASAPEWYSLGAGQVYRDPGGRFEVTAPSAMVFKPSDDGVVFNTVGPTLTGWSHTVFVFPKPADPSGKRFALLSTAQRVEELFRRRGVRMRVLHEAQTMRGSAPTMELEVRLVDKWQRTFDQLAVVRLIERDGTICWVCTARAVAGEATVTVEHRQRADAFVDAVRIIEPGHDAPAESSTSTQAGTWPREAR
jgi:hypothetical protein